MRGLAATGAVRGKLRSTEQRAGEAGGSSEGRQATSRSYTCPIWLTLVFSVKADTSQCLTLAI